MELIIIIVLLLILLVIWLISMQHKLVVMDENVKNSMNQIGIQLSSRFDVLTTLLKLAGEYDEQEAAVLLEKVKTGRKLITGRAAPEEIRGQEKIICEALDGAARIAGQHPQLKEDQSYIKCMDAIESYGKMIRTSGLIYNDSVTRLNKSLRMFPTGLVAGILGFHKRAYLEDMPV